MLGRWLKFLTFFGGDCGSTIIPTISSMSEDVLRAVPKALRDASYAGRNKLETVVKFAPGGTFALRSLFSVSPALSVKRWWF
jgi:hypothetical protein